ncbi:hypothetical protein BpHYR1_046710 [Brachionus plicatilis]|uniref:Uncharacterized protein n=1 Tax=Brachionus plicatilis TaxID=10195 RepID=A0A3M7PNL7_BRAPC|nr:hypothetical protein BpHYR1_046710 [Brachionus plicatilis]
MFHFPQGSENQFPSGSELLPCEQVPELANFRKTQCGHYYLSLLPRCKTALTIYIVIVITKISLPSTENGIIIYTHDFVSRTRAYN